MNEEESIIKKLEAQKNSVQPSRELLSKIIDQLPVEQQQENTYIKQQFSFAWLRFAIPTGVALLVGGIFLGTQFATPQLSESNNQSALDSAIVLEAPTTPSQDNSQAIAPSESSLSEFSTPVPTEKALSLASIEAEELRINDQLNFDQFFEDEIQMQEIDVALAEF